MGIGEEWNDVFLDALASSTGGTSAYINSPSAVVRFLNERVRSLGDAFAERMHLSIAPDADVVLESVFKLHPSPQPIEIKPQPIPIGALEYNRPDIGADPIADAAQYQNWFSHGGRAWM